MQVAQNNDVPAVMVLPELVSTSAIINSLRNDICCCCCSCRAVVFGRHRLGSDQAPCVLYILLAAQAPGTWKNRSSEPIALEMVVYIATQYFQADNWNCHRGDASWKEPMSDHTTSSYVH